jgi:hypothetical protein
MKVGKCNLCLKNKELLSKSHIFPEFLIKDIFNEKHQVVMFTPNNLRGKKIQSGYWESDILCEDCDNRILSKLERYFEINIYSKVIKTMKDKEAPISNTLPLRIDADRDMVKLFFLSILWRSSILKGSTFQPINLGPHQEKIRKIIFESRKVNFYKYPYAIFTFLNRKSFANMDSYATILTTPRHYRDHSGHQYRLLFPGFLIQIYISGHNLPDFFRGMEINNNIVLIGITTQSDSKEFINQTLNAKVF